mmetsp:Transcript_32484/g.60017  ORF Transcript_32484/g.60017 Transcript_32484/m.60017 type:complete len:107 (+) Transcript_32484:115-435(+)
MMKISSDYWIQIPSMYSFGNIGETGCPSLPCIWQGERPPAIYDYSGFVYVPGGCKSQEGSIDSFGPHLILDNDENLVRLLDPNSINVFIWQYWGDWMSFLALHMAG